MKLDKFCLGTTKTPWIELIQPPPTHRAKEKRGSLRTAYLPNQEWLWWECLQWSRLGWVLFPSWTKQMGPPPDNPTFSHHTFHLDRPTLLPEISLQNSVLTFSKTWCWIFLGHAVDFVLCTVFFILNKPAVYPYIVCNAFPYGNKQ